MAEPQCIIGNDFPPPHLWGLDPLFRCGIKLFISEVKCLQQVEGFNRVYILYNHPVTRFDIVGVIVSVDRKEQLVKFQVDDGTGVIICCVWLNSKDFSYVLSYKHGDLVAASGKLNIFREDREIIVDRITLEEDPNFEAFHWTQIMKYRELYKQPVVYPPDLASITQTPKT